VKHDFSDAEMWSQRFDDPARDAWQKPGHVVELMALEEGMTVADLGAGTGYFLPHLAGAVGAKGHVLGLDPEPGMVEFMTQRAERQGLKTVEARRIPFDSPSLAEGEANRILIVNTWHHIGDRRAYSALLAKSLAPGGAVFIVDYTRDSPSGPPVAARLPPEQVMEELAAGGLEVELVEEDLPRQYVVRGRRVD
jgi:SAM-dependent methyltransferase